MQMYRRLDVKNSYFTPGRGTLLQNADGTVSVIHALTWGSLQQRGPVEVSASLFFAFFRIRSCFCVRHQAIWLLVQTGVLVVSLHLFVPLRRSKFKCWKPWRLWCQDVGEKVDRARHACNAQCGPVRGVSGTKWPVIVSFTRGYGGGEGAEDFTNDCIKKRKQKTKEILILAPSR